jgi:plastocyanin
MINAAPTTTEVTIIKFKFLPQEITINTGDRVRWVNKEKRQYHSVWFEKLGEPEPDYLFPGDVYERLFETRGDFPYRCGPHPEMTGIVHLK